MHAARVMDGPPSARVRATATTTAAPPTLSTPTATLATMAPIPELLPLTSDKESQRQQSTPRRRTYTRRHLALAYGAGILSAVLARSALCAHGPFLVHGTSPRTAVTQPGSTEVHHYPPSPPTNAFPDLFPSNVGYPGPTPTGAEPAIVVTAPAYPVHSGAPHLLPPESLKNASSSFDIFTHWGNLSPWFTIKPGTFGVHSGPEAPEGCRITGLHLLHRHGARYPTASSKSYGGPANLSALLHDAPSRWRAKDQLEFLHEW